MNLELRRKVAEAIGEKVILMNGKLYEDCTVGCLTPHILISPYDTDHHAALDALMAFCEGIDYEWEIRRMKTGRYNCTIWKCGPRPPVDPILMTDEFNDSLAICICKAIVAARKSEKREAGAGEGA